MGGVLYDASFNMSNSRRQEAVELGKLAAVTFWGKPSRTLSDVAEELGVCHQRVYQWEAAALYKLGEMMLAWRDEFEAL